MAADRLLIEENSLWLFGQKGFKGIIRIQPVKEAIDGVRNVNISIQFIAQRNGSQNRFGVKLI